MNAYISSVIGACERCAVASLFSPGSTHAKAGESAGFDDFEVVVFLAVLTGEAALDRHGA